MRIFVAIDFPEKIKEEIKKLLEKLKEIDSNIKWVKPENIHITIKFLGEVAGEEKIENINNRLKEICSSYHNFNISISDIGSFPDWKSPRILWLDVDEGKEELIKLARVVDKEFGDPLFGVEKEKRSFNAHITIARIKKTENLEKLKSAIDNLIFKSDKIKVQEIILMKSTLTSNGPIYEPISYFPLLKS